MHQALARVLVGAIAGDDVSVNEHANDLFFVLNYRPLRGVREAGLRFASPPFASIRRFTSFIALTQKTKSGREATQPSSGQKDRFHLLRGNP